MLYAMLSLMAVVTAAGVWLADRRFAGRPVVLGLFFGALAVIANTASVLSVAEYDIALSLRDAPVIAAALFFGPLPGIIAGAIAAVERALTPLFGIGAATWCPLSTFLVALLAAAVRRWFLNGKRPYFAPALMLGVVFEQIHLAFDVLMGLDRLSRCCEIVFSAFVPEAYGLVLALVLSVFAVRSVVLHQFWRSRAALMLLAYLACCVVVIGSMLICSEIESIRMVAGCDRRLEHLFESQIDGILHIDAAWICDNLRDPAKRTSEGFNRFLDDDDYDELNVVGKDGVVKISNIPDNIGFNFSSHPETRPYLQLLDGSKDYIGEPFRNSFVRYGDGVKMKYAAAPLPDGGGFIQLGFRRDRFESEFRRYFFPLFEGVMNFFEGDYNIIASTNTWRIALANGGHRDAIGSLVQAVGIRPGYSHARLFGEWCHVGEKYVGEWCIFSVVPLVEAYGDALVNGAVLVLVLFALVFGFRVVNLRMRRQQKRIELLRVEVDRRRSQELETAAKIQQSSLPVDLPGNDRFSIAARMRPAKEVGGDFYDAYRLSDGRVVLAIADVSGKGVPGAMFMIKAESVLKTCVSSNPDLAAAVADANFRLEQQNDAQMFVTVWIGIFDPQRGEVEFVNGGHNPPLIRRSDGSVEWVRTRGGMALGVFCDCKYKVERLQLGPGESLLLYTDGVTEAQDVRGGFYGEDRLAGMVAATERDFVAAVFDSVDAFAGSAEQADDITALELEVR